MRTKAKVALVQDALPFLGGAERVLAAVLEIFPDAHIYTLVYNRKGFAGSNPFEGREIHTSLIDRLPAARSHHRAFLPLYPLAIERFDLRRYDILLSFSYAVAHGILAQAEQLHLSYIFTPLRYAWHYHDEFLREKRLVYRKISWPIKLFVSALRSWDLAASKRVDRYIAVSQSVARRVWQFYRRPALVIYPPVDVHRFKPAFPREDFYVVVSRLAAHKKVSLVVEAFATLGLPLLVVGDGPEYARLARRLPHHIRLLGWQPDDIVSDLLGKARAIVHAGEEDFGIALVEAQASGCPVISYGGGGALETVIPGKTGEFFAEQSVDSIIEAVESFEKNRSQFELSDLLQNAQRFRKERFAEQFASLVQREWERMIGG